MKLLSHRLHVVKVKLCSLTKRNLLTKICNTKLPNLELNCKNYFGPLREGTIEAELLKKTEYTSKDSETKSIGRVYGWYFPFYAMHPWYVATLS